MGFTLSQIIKPQYIAFSTAAPLTLVTGIGSPAPTGTTVPNQTQLSLWTCRIVNVTSSPVSIEVLRVTAGGSPTTQWLVVPTITIPVATEANPYFEWDPHYQMAPGDAIWAVSTTVNAVTISGDGGITV